MSGNPESRSPSTSLRAGSEVVPFPKRTSGDARAYIDNPLPGAPGSRLVLGANLGDTLPHFQRGVSSSHASRSTALSGIRTVPLGSLGFARDFGSRFRRPLDASTFSCYCRRPYFATVEVFGGWPSLSRAFLLSRVARPSSAWAGIFVTDYNVTVSNLA